MCQCRMERLRFVIRQSHLSLNKYDHTNERNVILHVAGETWVVLETAECGNAGEDGVGLCQH